MVPLTWYLGLAAFVFGCGLYAALARRNAIAVLIGVELMLNAVNINLVAFWRYSDLLDLSSANILAGQVFALFVIAIAGAEAAVGLALIISVYRTRRTVQLDELDLLRG